MISRKLVTGSKNNRTRSCEVLIPALLEVLIPAHKPRDPNQETRITISRFNRGSYE